MRHRSIVSISLASLVLIGILSGCSSSEEQQEKYLKRAQVLFDDGDNERARLELRNVLQINNENAKAHYLTALIKESENNWGAMAGSLHATIQYDPDHIDARIKLSQLLYLYGRSANDKVMEQVDAILALDPSNAEANAILAKVLLREPDTEAAAVAAQLSLKSDPSNIEAITVLATIYTKEDPERVLVIINDGIEHDPEQTDLKLLKIQFLKIQQRPEEAIVEYERLIADHPETPDFLQQFIGYLLRLSRSGDAVKILQERIAENPENTELKVSLVATYAMTNKLPQAEATAKQFLADAPEDIELQFLLARIYNTTGNTSGAQGVFESIIALDKDGPDSLRARNAIAQQRLVQGDKESAKSILKEIFDIEPQNTGALINRAQLKLSEGDTTGAVIDLRTVVSNNPTSTQALLMLGQAHEMNNSTERALEVYRDALSLEPRNKDALLKVIRLLETEGDSATLVRVLESSHEVQPTDPDISRLLIGAYSKQSRWKDALAVAEKLKQHEKTKALGTYLEGHVLYAQKDQVSAIAAFKEAIALEPGSTEALSSLVQAIYSETGKQDALDYLAKHIERYPDQINGREQQAALYIQGGNFKAAIQSYQAALLIDPERAQTHLALARVYEADARFQESLDSYDTAIRFAPDNKEILIIKAGVFEKMKRYKDAAEAYESALAMNEKQSVAANNLAMVLVDHLPSNENFERALAVTEKFEDSEVPTFLDTRGWVHYKMSDYKAALPLFKKAAESEGSQPIFHYHLGMAYYQLGDTEMARKELAVALKNGSEFPGSDAAKKLAKEL